MVQQLEPKPGVEEYVAQVKARLLPASPEVRESLVEQLRARIELEQEIHPAAADGAAGTRAFLDRMGSPQSMADRLLRDAGLQADDAGPFVPMSALVPCRTCAKEVSREAMACPHCGAPFPTRAQWKGHGYEWKSKQRLLGLPLVHVAWGRDENNKLRVAKGIIAIGQFGIGAITIAQFGVGAIFGPGQFVAAPIAVGQFALGIAALGQFGIGLLAGFGQFSTGLLWHRDMWSFLPPGRK